MSALVHLTTLWESGELGRIAQGAASWAEVAKRIGMTRKALYCAIVRIKAKGRTFPTLEELGGVRQQPLTGAASLADEFNGEEPTQPGHPWPNVAAFDAAEVEVPAPVVPVGHVLRGVSTLVDETGAVKQQWVKTVADGSGVDPAEVLRLAFGEAMPKCDPVSAPTHTMADLLATYQIGDGHLGLHAWRHDSQGDWDLSIAERVLFDAADKLVALSPPARRGLVVNIGDFFHADSNAGTTTKGTRVDMDTRWSKVLAVGIRLMRRIIERALEKHDEVTVINEIGNHDTHTSVVLALCLAQFYEREPRVVIDTSPQHFHYYRFGKVLLATHHGHMVKLDKLPGVMAADRPADWGETEHRHWITGHVHHVTFHEFPGCTVRTLGVLAPGDAWHTASGYRSGRQMIGEVYHREQGLLTTNTVGYHQLVAA